MTVIADSVPLLLHLLLVSPFSSKFLRLQVSKVQGGDEEVVSGQGERAGIGHPYSRSALADIGSDCSQFR